MVVRMSECPSLGALIEERLTLLRVPYTDFSRRVLAQSELFNPSMNSAHHLRFVCRLFPFFIFTELRRLYYLDSHRLSFPIPEELVSRLTEFESRNRGLEVGRL